MKLTAEQYGALSLLADAGPRGCTEAVLMAHEFTVTALADLVRAGLASVTSETTRAFGRMIA